MLFTIIGSCGFIGSHLMLSLKKEGHIVVGLDLPAFNLALPECFNMIPEATDVVIHSAGILGNTANEELAWQINVESMYHLVNHLNKKTRIKLFIYLSTGGVYGYANQVHDDTSRINPKGFYACSKALAENVIDYLSEFEAINLRLFFPYGPGQKAPRLIPVLINKIQRHEPIEINTAIGFPTINPIYIDDLMEIIERLVGLKVRKRIYNIGGLQYLTIRQISEQIALLLHKEVEFIIRDSPEDNLFCVPDLLTDKKTDFVDGLLKILGST